MSIQGTNVQLERLLREAGWTLRQCAQAVNRIGTERGTPTRYTAPSVHQWISGSVPRDDARPLVVEAFARRLGRPVTTKDLGFPAPQNAGKEDPTSTADGLIDLGRADMDPARRSMLGAALFSVALSVPEWPDVVGRMERAQLGLTTRIGRSDVQSVIAMTEKLSEMDDQFGGRTARPLAAAFMVNTVAPLLRTEGPDDVRKAMMSAASDLSYLTGFMAVDEGLQGLAQRYYLRALELAGASEDHLTFCTTLRGMSVQAVDLKHGPVAMRLADAAAAASPAAGPRMRAFLAGQQAHAAALVGDRRSALMYLNEAEAAMDRAEARGRVFGSYDPAALAYHTAQVRFELGDTNGAVTALEQSDRLRPSAYLRTRVQQRTILAERQLAVGHLEQACVTWNAVLDDFPSVQSERIDKALTNMMGLIAPHIRNSAAQALHERARVNLRPDLVPVRQ
ncbi:tetratricopeptide repeat protein [Streptomyces sp. NPDC002125]